MNNEKQNESYIGNLDTLICNISSSNTKKNHIDLYRSLLNSEIFASIANKDTFKIDGIQFPYTTIENNKMVMFYTSKDDQRLGKPFSGLMGNKALEMILEIEDIDGILLQSVTQQSWFAMTKEQIVNILGERNQWGQSL